MEINNPEQIKSYLDKYVAGQETAKKVLSVACFQHLQSIELKTQYELMGIKPQKQNVLLIGPSGCGKTFMLGKLADLMQVPMAIIDSTVLTQSGYTGAEPEMIIERLYDAADGCLEKAEQGIIFLDEIDKKAKKTYWSGGGDHCGIGVQQCLLKLLEDAKVSFQKDGETITLDTSNILFVAGGAFPGLEKIIAKRSQPKDGPSLGLTLKQETPKPPEAYDTIIKQVSAADIIEFGFLHEFIGRFPVIVTLEELKLEELCHILTKVDNNLVDQYKALFEFDNIILSFEDEAIEVLAARAKKLGCGARSLKTVMEQLLLYPMFSAPGLVDKRKAKLVITKEIAKAGKCPYVIRKRSVPKSDR